VRCAPNCLRSASERCTVRESARDWRAPIFSRSNSELWGSTRRIPGCASRPALDATSPGRTSLARACYACRDRQACADAGRDSGCVRHALKPSAARTSLDVCVLSVRPGGVTCVAQSERHPYTSRMVSRLSGAFIVCKCIDPRPTCGLFISVEFDPLPRCVRSVSLLFIDHLDFLCCSL
jgi:hypothetical protein